MLTNKKSFVDASGKLLFEEKQAKFFFFVVKDGCKFLRRLWIKVKTENYLRENAESSFGIHEGEDGKFCHGLGLKVSDFYFRFE